MVMPPLGQLCELSERHPSTTGRRRYRAAGGRSRLAGQSNSPPVARNPADPLRQRQLFASRSRIGRATAKQMERNPRAKRKKSHATPISLDNFEQRSKIPPKHFAEGLRETERTRRAIQEVQSVLDSLMGELSPAFSQTFDVLEDISHFFQRIPECRPTRSAR